VKLFM